MPVVIGFILKTASSDEKPKKPEEEKKPEKPEEEKAEEGAEEKEEVMNIDKTKVDEKPAEPEIKEGTGKSLKDASYTEFICIFGYSLIWYIPATLLAVIPARVPLQISFLLTTFNLDSKSNNLCNRCIPQHKNVL
jgi:hypothetical protein